MAGRTPVPERENIASLAEHGATMVIFLSASLLDGLQEALLQGAYTQQTPAALVYKATWPEEKVVRCPLGELAQAGRDHGISKTALVLVGDFCRETIPEAGCMRRISPRSFGGHPNEAGICGVFRPGLCPGPAAGPGFGGTATRCGVDCPLRDWIREAFSRYEGLVFVGAVGIAVRAIAPYVQSKTTDPAVVVVDEGGRFVIPLLSGHLGGANGLAHRIAAAGGGSPVITTATDGRGLFAVDSWAKEQNCHVMEPERIKGVSGKLLEGETIWMRCPWAVSGLQPEGVLLGEARDCDVEVTLSPGKDPALHLVPKILVLGVGCRSGVGKETLAAAVAQTMERLHFVPQAIARVCSIDLKKEEPGLLAFCAERKLPFLTYSPEELAQVAGDFTPSEFVRQVTGIDNVCERSAVLGSGGGPLLQRKCKGDGVTLAVAQIPFQPEWRW